MVGLSLSVIIFGCVSSVFEKIFGLAESQSNRQKKKSAGRYDSAIEEDVEKRQIPLEKFEQTDLKEIIF